MFLDRSLADQIAESAGLAQSAYQKLLKLRPHDASLLETYAGFVESIGNDPDEAKKFLRRSEDMQQRQAKAKRSSFGGVNAIDEESGILTVDASGELDNGRIVAANTQIGRVFNQNSDNILGKNIGSILVRSDAHVICMVCIVSYPTCPRSSRPSRTTSTTSSTASSRPAMIRTYLEYHTR